MKISSSEAARLRSDAPLHVAREGAEGLGVLRAAQQVEQGLVVVFAGGLQRGQAHGQLALKIGNDETF